MSNTELIKQIKYMSSWELLEWVIHNPTDLTDGYYREFRDAILARYEELKVLRDS